MIQFLQTSAFWALAGLSIPIAIHFLSRKEGKVIRIGSIRHLEETTTQKFKGIRLNEILLLIVRCLLLAVFVLLLAGLLFFSKATGTNRWLLLEKGMEEDNRLKDIRDSLIAQGFETRFLSKHFPTLDNSGEDSSSYYQLIYDLKKEDLQTAIVVSYNKNRRFKGERVDLPSHVRWISLPSPSNQFEINSWIGMGDSLYTRIGSSQEVLTHFETKRRKLQGDELASMSRPAAARIAIISDAAHGDDKRMMEAALESIQDYQHVTFQITTHEATELETVPTAADFLIWLADAPLPTSANNILYLKPGQDNALIVQESPFRWRITRLLNPDLALQENLTLQLASHILASENATQEVQRNDARVIPDSFAWRQNTQLEDKVNSGIWQGADSYLLYILLFLIVIERIVAYQRKQ